MKKAIVQKRDGQWHITSIGLNDLEIVNLRYQLRCREENPNYVLNVPFTVDFREGGK